MTLISNILGLLSGTSWQQYAIILAAAIVLWISYQAIYQVYLSPLSPFPGPFWAQLTDLWHVAVITFGQEHTTIYALHRKHGPIVRLGPNKLSVTDEAGYRKIYNAAAPFAKSSYYDPYKLPGVRDVFTERNESMHGKLRRPIAGIFSSEGIKDLDGNIDGTLRKFISQMESFEGQNLDLGQWFERLLFDCISDMAFEQNLGLLDRVSENNLFEWVYGMLREAHTLGAAPTLFTIASFVTRIIGPEDPAAKYKGNDVDKIIERFMEHQEKSKTSGQPQRNLASRLLQVQAAGKSDAMTDKELRLLLQVILIAGTTDAVTWLNSIFYHLIYNPGKKAKLLQELREKRAKGELEDVCTSQQAAACPYLNAVLQESLRLYPSNAGLLPRETPKAGVELSGHHIPAGVTIGAPAYVVQRLPQVFGVDTDSFLPERWLDNSKNTDMNRFIMGFGLGSRTCLGRNLAYMEMRKIVPTLILALDFDQPIPAKDWAFANTAAIHQSNFYARVRKRVD